MTRGLRNNNPFNLKRSNNNWLGKIPYSQSKDKVFETFTTLDYGLRAGMINLCTLASRCRDLSELLNRYAPPSENDTQKYIDYVYTYLSTFECSIELDDLLRSPNSFRHLCMAICIFESGVITPSFKCDLYRVFEHYKIRRSMLRAQLTRTANHL